MQNVRCPSPILLLSLQLHVHLLHKRWLVQPHAQGLGASAQTDLTGGTNTVAAHAQKAYPALWTSTILPSWLQLPQPQALQEVRGGGGPEKPAS